MVSQSITLWLSQLASRKTWSVKAHLVNIGISWYQNRQPENSASTVLSIGWVDSIVASYISAVKLSEIDYIFVLYHLLVVNVITLLVIFNQQNIMVYCVNLCFA